MSWTSRTAAEPTPMRRSRLGLRARSRRGAAGFLFFVLIGVPLLFFSAALSVDFTMHIMAANQAGAAAEAAASAAAFQQSYDRDTLDHGLATATVREVFERAKRERVMSLTRDPQLVEPTRIGQRQVDVTVSFALPVRTFTKWFVPGAQDNERFEVTRTALVCTPNVATGPTEGFCASPMP